MSTQGENDQGENDKERNQTIARNEEQRQVTGDIRVSAWTIVFAIIAGVVLFFAGWAWLHR
jgi:hypothetical protein